MKTYYVLPMLFLFNFTYSQQVDLINENFDSGIPANWTHCSTNWGTSPVWAVDSGALKEASGWYFVATSNMFTLPAVDLTLISNPFLEFDLAMAITDTNIQLSVWWTNDTTCNKVWDTINNQWLLDSSWTLLSSYGSSTSGAANIISTDTSFNNNWTPLSTDYQMISIDLSPFANDSNIRFGLSSDYLNYGASGVWYVDNVKVSGISVGQTSQIDCSKLSVTDIVINNTNLTIDISIYNGDTNNINYPYIGLVVDNNGDTIQNGSINFFLHAALDTQTYSYSLADTVSAASPYTIYFAYSDMVGSADTCILNYTTTPDFCDSMNVTFIELDTTGNPHLIDFEIETFYTSSHLFGYCGFILLNNMGDTIAYENISTAANVFGIGPTTTEIRTLDVTQNLALPFSGTIYLIEGWFAGNPGTQCSFPFNISSGTTGIEEPPMKAKKLLLITDLLGRTTHPTSNILLFYLYDDGSVEKRIQLER